MDKGAKTKTKIIVESDGSPKVSVEFMERSNELDDSEDEEDPQLSKLPNNIPIQTTVYLPANRRVQPVFWFNKHFLSISQFGIPSGIGV